jgi:DNA-binding NarL/FixJ family response regulator
MVPRAVAKLVLERLRRTRAEPDVALTVRERDILESILEGDAIKQTARKLGITIKTVQNVQSRLFRKLDARNRAQAITRAHELGLLPPLR